MRRVTFLQQRDHLPRASGVCVDVAGTPTIIRGHTHAPAIVIGEIAADLLRGERSSSTSSVR